MQYSRPVKEFEDIIAWQKAQELVVIVYRIFRDSRDFGFRDQICRAAVSVSNNIAEGFERGSDPDFRRFLFMAKGSSGEVRSMAYTGKALGYLEAAQFREIRDRSTEIGCILGGFIKKLGK